MNWKEFLKPDLRKIVIFVLLFIFSLFITYPGFCIDGINFGYCEKHHGFPLPCYTTYGENDVSPSGQSLKDVISNNNPGIIFNLIFWFIISCCMIWTYEKIKKR